MELLFTHPALPLGFLLIVAAYLLLSRGLKKAEDSDNETMDALVQDMEQANGRIQALEDKVATHGKNITTLTLRGVK